MKNKLFIISLLLTCFGSGYAQRIVCDSTCKIEYGGDTTHSAVNYAVVSPVGRSSVEMIEMAPRLETLEGKTIAIVGGHIANYDFMIALNHFKGHPMGGYGGALKNLSIGCASSNGKAYIHSSGKMEKLDMEKLWTPEFIGDQDGFLESMAAAAQAVTNYFNKRQGIIYINVMNNMSIDCDCVDHPAPVKLEDYGILASTDPVALDQACVDIINNQQVTAINKSEEENYLFPDGTVGDEPAPLVITSKNQIDDSYYNRLVRIEGCRLQNGGVDVFCPDSVTTYCTRYMLLTDSTVISLRTMNRATFAHELLPAGRCNLKGILVNSSSGPQLYLRSLEDVE